MKKSVLFAISILSLSSAVAVIGEDRIERINNPKGPGNADTTKELVYRNDSLVEEITYDSSGALKEDSFFDSTSIPVQTRSYIRDRGRLERVEYKDASGLITGSLSYRYDRDDRLLGVDADGDLGTTSVGMISSGAMPQASWVSGDTTTVHGYDDSGREVIVQTMKDGDAVSVERTTYSDNGILSSVRIEDKAASLVNRAEV